ncbi:hypothetical protein BASA81_007107 [Batrachochytrium salamandrivorans]|nr:hypothetical protein BASA81_007107 [Batrachochytrium salamandrivorans]
MTCTYDLDCPNNMACMINASWFDPTTHQPCMCNLYYGFSNPALDCGEVLATPTSWFLVISGAMLGLFAFCLATFSLWEFVRLVRNKMLASDAQTVGSVQILLSALCIVGDQAGTVATALMPWRAYTSLTPPFGDKANDYHTVWMSVMCVSAVLALSGAITIAMMWIEMAERVVKLRRFDQPQSGSFQRKTLVFGMEALVLVCILIPVFVGQAGFAVVASFIIQIGTLLLYLYGSLKITKVVTGKDSLPSHQSPATSPMQNEYRQVLRRMYKSTLIICTVAMCGCVFSIVMLVAGLYGWKEYAVPGQVCLAVVAFQMLTLFVLLVGCETIRFLSQSTSRKLLHRRRVGSLSHTNSKELALPRNN